MENKILIPDTEIKNSFQIRRLNNTVFERGVVTSVIYNRIFIIEEGKGTVTIDDKELNIAALEVLIISKGQMFLFSPQTKLSGIEILFGDCFWEKSPASASDCKMLLFNDSALHQKIPLSERFPELNDIGEMMLKEFLNDDYPNKQDAMAAYLKVMMIKLANLVPAFDSRADNSDHHIYRKFLELVSRNYDKMHDVQYYADQLSVTPRKLSAISKRKRGKGAKEIIASQIIAESKRQLQFSAKTIKEIGYELSFSNPDQFSHFFKNHTGKSPADYRKIFLNIGR